MCEAGSGGKEMSYQYSTAMLDFVSMYKCADIYRYLLKVQRLKWSLYTVEINTMHILYILEFIATMAPNSNLL